MPKAREKDADAHRLRKDSIGMPRPLGSPFDMERAMSVGPHERRDGERGGEVRYALGEAI